MTAPDPRLGEIEDRLAAATPGPWEVEVMDAGHSRYEMNVWVTAGDGDTICDMDGLNRSRNESVAKDDGYKDATLIANAPMDLAYLLAELRTAREALARVEALHRPVADWDHSEAELCTECYDTHPCPTFTALRAAVAAADGGGEK